MRCASALINILDVRPGGIDRSTLGHPGKFSYCIAEDEEDTPWLPLSEVRGIPKGLSAVTVMAAGAPRQIMNEWTTKPEEILETFAAEMRANLRHYSIHAGNYAIVIPKQLRDHLQAAGWDKARHRRGSSTSGHAVSAASGPTSARGRWCVIAATAFMPPWTSPEHLLVIAAGGPAGGFGAVIPPWLGEKARAVTVADRRLRRLLSRRKGRDTDIGVHGLGTR